MGNIRGSMRVSEPEGRVSNFKHLPTNNLANDLGIRRDQSKFSPRGCKIIIPSQHKGIISRKERTRERMRMDLPGV
jgi:hypothetical protein